MKTQILTTLLASSALLSTAMSHAEKNIGIHSSQLKIECTGEFIITKVMSTSVSLGSFDRAGKYYPAHGFGHLEVQLQNLSSGCELIKSKLGVDIKTGKYTEYFSTLNTDPDQIKQEAQKKIGKITKFKVKQSFYYEDENGHLPFFPLLHKEHIIVGNQSFEVNNYNAYGIFLNEEDKIKLTEMIFDYINKKGKINNLSSQLINALTQNHVYPKWEKNFEVYLEKLLVLFNQLEENHITPKEGIDLDFQLSALASGINQITHQYPEYNSFNIPELVAGHPSLLKSVGTFPNMSAVQLEEVINIIETKLADGSMPSNIKAAYQNPLEYMAGNYTPEGKLGQLSSKFVHLKASELLNKYYKLK